uniref:Uncharacterized protein n=1 Tax=Solanum tuberosum TaxID=4113 RepID=M1CF48_SOLTU
MVDVPRVAGTKVNICCIALSKTSSLQIQLSHITTFSAKPPRSLLMHSDPPC